MDQIYFCKFNENGRHIKTQLTCEFTDEEKQQKIAEDYIEISDKANLDLS